MDGGIDGGVRSEERRAKSGIGHYSLPTPHSSLSYIELRAHSAFSFGDGAVTPQNIVKRARRLGYTHLGITDTADLGGLVRFGEEAMVPPKDRACQNAEQHVDLGAEDCPRCQRKIHPI